MRKALSISTITIDRTAEGRFRAELFEDPRLIIEHDELSELVEDLKRNLDLIAVMPDGRHLVGQVKTSVCAILHELLGMGNLK